MIKFFTFLDKYWKQYNKVLEMNTLLDPQHKLLYLEYALRKLLNQVKISVFVNTIDSLEFFIKSIVEFMIHLPRHCQI